MMYIRRVYDNYYFVTDNYYRKYYRDDLIVYHNIFRLCNRLSPHKFSGPGYCKYRLLYY